MRSGRVQLAEASFRACLADEPGHAGAHAMLGLCLADQERFEDAGREAGAAVAAAPDDAFAHYAVARILHLRNRFDEAERAIGEAVRLDPDDADYRGAKAAILASRERWSDCLTTAEEGLALDAEHVMCTNLRGLALTHLGRRAEAEGFIDESLRRNPENALSHANQGWTLLHQGDPRRAATHFREALRLDPDNEWARRGIVEALKARNIVYRWMLAWFLWLSRQPSGMRWAIIIGVFVGLQGLSHLVEKDPSQGWWVWPVLGVLVVFAWSSWLASPLFNLTLLLSRDGRHALSRDQIQQGLLIGSIILAAVGFALYLFPKDHIWLFPLMVFFLAIPCSAIHTCSPGWPRRTMILVCSVLALVAFGDASYVSYLIAFDPKAPAGAGIAWVKASITPFLYGTIASQFIAIALSRAQPTR
ncbi:MAG: tetratricopeptide repeat protein [Planctomycetes bacterium]|nr:tetratricopeptide repeat protein [Planctomycetota bacterium]